MDKNKLTISSIETFLYEKIDNVVSKNTYVGTLPETMKSEWSDMCLIDVGNTIEDLNAFGSGIVHILLYAKPLSNGEKNVSTLKKMEETLNKVINSSSNSTYVIKRQGLYSDYDINRKWHCNIIALNIKIF